MADTSTQSIQVHAPADRVAAVISDFRRYPEWAEAMKEVEVLEEYEDGYAAQVRFVITPSGAAQNIVVASSFLVRSMVLPFESVCRPAPEATVLLV